MKITQFFPRVARSENGETVLLISLGISLVLLTIVGVAQFSLSMQSKSVIRHSDAIDAFLLNETNAWLSYFSEKAGSPALGGSAILLATGRSTPYVQGRKYCGSSTAGSKHCIQRTYSSFILDDNPLAYWRFGENSVAGGAVDQKASFGGAYNGGITLSQPGSIFEDRDTAIKLDGTTASVSIPDNAALKPNAFSFEAWVNLAQTTSLKTCGLAPNTAQYIGFKKNSRTGQFETYSLTLFGGSFCMTLANSVGFQTQLCSPTPVVPGNWYHLVATFNQPNMNLFVNGGSPVTASHGYALDYGNRPLSIGRSGECGGPGEENFDAFFAGKIDEVALYNYALPANKVLTHYRAGSPY